MALDSVPTTPFNRNNPPPLCPQRILKKKKKRPRRYNWEPGARDGSVVLDSGGAIWRSIHRRRMARPGNGATRREGPAAPRRTISGARCISRHSAGGVAGPSTAFALRGFYGARVIPSPPPRPADPVPLAGPKGGAVAPRVTRTRDLRAARCPVHIRDTGAPL